MDIGQLAGMFGPTQMLGAFNAVQNNRTATDAAIAKVEESRALAQQYLAQAGAMNQQTRDQQSVAHLLPAAKQAAIEKDRAAASKDDAETKSKLMGMLPQKLTEGLSLIESLPQVQLSARKGDVGPAQQYLGAVDSYVQGLAQDGLMSPEMAAAILSKKGGAKITAFKNLHKNLWENAPDYLKQKSLQDIKLAHDSKENALNRDAQIKSAKISGGNQDKIRNMDQLMTYALISKDDNLLSRVQSALGGKTSVMEGAKNDAKLRNLKNTLDMFKGGGTGAIEFPAGEYKSKSGVSYKVE